MRTSILWHIILTSLKTSGQRTAVIQALASTTSSHLLHLVGRVAELINTTVDVIPASPEPQIVAVYLSNSLAYITTVLSALKLGCAFLAIDPSWPPERIHAVLNQSQPAVTVWAAHTIAGGNGPPDVGGLKYPILELTPQLLHVDSRINTDQPAVPFPQKLASHHQPKADTSHQLEDGAAMHLDGQMPYCYVLHTSGSTGVPLGVCGTEEGVLNRANWMRQAYPFKPNDRVAFKTSPCFVDSIWEVFGPLLAGVTVVPVLPEVLLSPLKLLTLCIRERITHLTAVPALWHALISCLETNPQLREGIALRLVVSSGEPLSWDLLARMKKMLPDGCTIWNLYGSTEVAADCTAMDCTHLEPSWGGAQLRQKACQPATQFVGDDANNSAAVYSWQAPVGSPISGMLVGIASQLSFPSSLSEELEQAQLQQHSTASASTESSESKQWELRESVQITNKIKFGPEFESTQGQLAGGATAKACQGAVCASQLELVPPGVVGEVLVGGVGLAAGYFQQPAATARRFVSIPSSQLSRRLLHGWPADGRPQLASGQAGAAWAEPTTAGKMHSATKLVESAAWVPQDAGPPWNSGSNSEEEAGQGVGVGLQKSSWAGLARAGSPEAGEPGAASESCMRLFRTGDLGYVDTEGRLRLCGRRDLQIKLSGVRVDLLEVEAMLSQHPAVSAAAARLWQLPAGPAVAAYVELHQPPVAHPKPPNPALPAKRHRRAEPSTALPSPQPGQGPCAVPAVPALPGEPGSPQLLLQWCRDRLPPAAVPAAVVPLGRLPRSSAGKVQRGVLPLPAGWQQAQQEQRGVPGGQGAAWGHLTVGVGGGAGGVRRLEGEGAECLPKKRARGVGLAVSPEGRHGRSTKQQSPLTTPQQGGVRGLPPGRSQQPASQSRHSVELAQAAAGGRPKRGGPSGSAVPEAGGTLGRSGFPAASVSELQVARAFAAGLQMGGEGALHGWGGAGLEPGTSIFTLGANSLVAAAIAELLGIDAELVYQYPTIRSLTTRLKASHTQQQHWQQQEQQQQQQLTHELDGVAPLLRGAPPTCAAAEGDADHAGSGGAGDLQQPNASLSAQHSPHAKSSGTLCAGGSMLDVLRARARTLRLALEPPAERWSPSDPRAELAGQTGAGDDPASTPDSSSSHSMGSALRGGSCPAADDVSAAAARQKECLAGRAGPRHGTPLLCMAWRCRMLQCVDAPPLAVAWPPWGGGNARHSLPFTSACELRPLGPGESAGVHGGAGAAAAAPVTVASDAETDARAAHFESALIKHSPGSSRQVSNACEQASAAPEGERAAGLEGLPARGGAAGGAPAGVKCKAQGMASVCLLPRRGRLLLGGRHKATAVAGGPQWHG